MAVVITKMTVVPGQTPLFGPTPGRIATLVVVRIGGYEPQFGRTAVVCIPPFAASPYLLLGPHIQS